MCLNIVISILNLYLLIIFIDNDEELFRVEVNVSFIERNFLRNAFNLIYVSIKYNSFNKSLLKNTI